MDETLLYPPIEPTNFDLIVVGTGLPESVIAAAASSAGKTVLHLDPNPFYGSHYSSLPLHELTSFLHSQSQLPPPNPPPSSAEPDGSEYSTVHLSIRPLYSDVEISSHSDEPLELSRMFNLDLAGPRVLFCSDLAVELILKSGVGQYIDFKSVDASFICDADGKLWTVPDSRNAIFKDRNLGYIEKNRLTSFFKLVEGHLKSVGSGDAENEEGTGRRVSEEDMESPFVEFLNKMQLPPKIKSIILYAIAMADYDQEIMEACNYVIKTRDGIDRLALYHSSIGRFPNALGALIYPLYGQGELPQAFCRRAAVKGCLYVLRMAVNAVLMDKGSGSYKGVKLASGQEVFSHQLVLDPSFIVSSHSPSDFLQDGSPVFGLRDVKGKAARGICITKSSLKPDVSNLLVLLPPRTLYPEQVTSIRVLQIGSNLAVCPSGMFVCYLSTLCEDATEGKKSLHAAINALFSIPVSENSENSSSDPSENTGEVKPSLLWSALYMQGLTKDSFESMSSTPMPDGNLNYNNVLDASMKLFQKMYPQEEFFAKTTSSDDPEDDAAPDLES